MTPMRQSDIHILHIVPGLGPGGMELTMARVVRGLAARGVRHTIACLKGEPLIEDEFRGWAEIHCMHARPNEVALPWRLRRLIHQVAPTVIHARNWGAWPDTAAARLMTWPPVPLVFSFHGMGDLSGMPRRRRIAFRLLPRLTTYLFTLSEASRRMLIAEYGWPAECGVIPNGVDTDRFRPAPPHPGRSRLAIGTVGNLRPIKNHGLLVRACADLGRAGVDWELRIAGDGPEREALTRLAAELGVAERVRLVGFIEDVPGFLQDLDIFALTSDSEQHPNGLTEAMACGLPCVATRVGGVPALLDGGQCGRIIALGDRHGLAAALHDLALAPDRGRGLGAAARRRACEHYSLELMIDRYEALYTRLTAGSRTDIGGPIGEHQAR